MVVCCSEEDGWVRGKFPPILYAIRVANDTVITQGAEPYARIELRLGKCRPDVSMDAYTSGQRKV